MQERLMLIAVLLILTGAATYMFMTYERPVGPAPLADIPPGAHVVTLTEDGFSPDTLTIRKGETVAFRTTIRELYWPASNLHPSHELYPEFDPLGPVQPTDVWAFTFNEPGEWKYHDHLAPYYTGVITVTE